MESYKELVKRRDAWNKLPEFNGRLHITTRYYYRNSDGSILNLGTDKNEAQAYRKHELSRGLWQGKLIAEPDLSPYADDPDTTVDWALNQDPRAEFMSAFVEKLEEVFNQ